jgi:hypothetical protein
MTVGKVTSCYLTCNIFNYAILVILIYARVNETNAPNPTVRKYRKWVESETLSVGIL